MKQGIHPEYVECTVKCTCGNVFTTRSTKSELKIDICNKCHPFFTGTQKLIDTGGRVQRFADKFGSAADMVAKAEAEKKAAKAAKAAELEAAKKAEREAKAAEKAKPIFTQPLGFVLCAAGAVEKFATDGTVSVVYLRDSISISKINAAFLTGQQIDRIHVQQLLLPSFMCQGAQHLLLYHVPFPKTIAFLTKDTHKNFPP